MVGYSVGWNGWGFGSNGGDVRASEVVVKRTTLQNKALHKYLTWVADALNDSGQDMRTLVKLPIRPTTENVKENMFKPVMTAMYPDKTSTTQLSTVEMQQVYEVFNFALSERLGIGFDWPHEEDDGWTK